MMLHKANQLNQCEIKFTGTDQDIGIGQFSGVASVFDGIDLYGDTIQKGAFTKTLKAGRRPLMFFNHDPYVVIGKWIDITETEKGLEVVGELTPNHKDAENVKASMHHGAISGLSIGYKIPGGGSEMLKDGSRLLTEIDLIEISVVARPADDHARISQVKSQISELDNLRDAERFLRESGGLSKSAATSFVSRFKTILRSDSVDPEEITSNLVAENTQRLTNLLTI